MMEKLFKFPIVMVDGNKEEEKEKRREGLGLSSNGVDEEVDIIIGEAECPYYDFVSVTDRWLPTDESYNKALDGRFDACSVYFSQSGSFVVPWNKEKFKKELKAFIKTIPKDKLGDDKSDIRIMTFTKDTLADALKNLPDEEEEDEK